MLYLLQIQSILKKIKGEKMDQKNKKKKTIKAVIAIVVVAAIVVGAVFIVKKTGKANGGAEDIMTEMIYRGAITSVVKGSGVALAKNSQTVTILSAGLVEEVFVKEGDKVSIGDPLYIMDATQAQKDYERAQRAYNAAQKELDEVYTAAYDPNVRADFSGLLLDVTALNPGDTITRGQVLGTLVDNSVMKLSLYFSYAYEDDIYVGQEADISIPSSMSVLKGKVSEIRKVKRVVPEGAVLFEVIFSVDNPGILTKGTAASASIALGKETIYPYASGTLDYNKTGSLKSLTSGEVESSRLWNYMEVKANESVVKLIADSSEDAVASAESAVTSAKKALDEAEKALGAVDAKATIDGTVLSIGVFEGEEAQVGTIAISIADTTTMQVKTSVDEMNVSNITVGMPVQVEQWGTMAFGYVESVSLSGQYENGVSTFPVVISIDNTEGTLMSGSYVEYSFTASQVDDCLVAPVQAVKYVETEEGTATVLFVKSDFEPENVVTLMNEATDIPSGYYPVKVEIGISDDYNVEIKEGVEEGTEIFVSTIRSEMW